MSRVLFADGHFEDEERTVLADEAEWPSAGRVAVSLARWRTGAAPAGLEAAVRVPNTEDIDAIAAELRDVPLVLLEFPKFGDGRAYSQARLLRERHGYRGQLRAVGDLIVDLLPQLRRCGFDAFELRSDQSEASALRCLQQFRLGYQHGAERAQTVWERRRAAQRP